MSVLSPREPVGRCLVQHAYLADEESRGPGRVGGEEATEQANSWGAGPEPPSQTASPGPQGPPASGPDARPVTVACGLPARPAPRPDPTTVCWFQPAWGVVTRSGDHWGGVCQGKPLS